MPRIINKKNALLTSWLICSLGAIFYCYEYLLRIEPSVMVPHLMHAFSITAGTFGLITALYYYAYTPLQLIVGVLLDRYGSRLIMTLAIIACAIGSFLFSTSTNLYVVGLGRFLIGFGSAFAFVGVLKLAAEWLPKHFALFAGFLMTIGMAGAMLGDIVLTAAVHHIGWQKTLYIGTIIGVILIPLMWLMVRDTPKWKSKHIGSKTSFSSAFNGLWCIIKSPQMWLTGLVGCSLYLSLSAFGELWGIPFLHAVYNLTPHQAAVACSMVFAGWLVGAPFAGWLTDKIKSRKIPLIFGGILTTITISIVIFKPIPLSLPLLSFILLLFGICASTEIICFVISKENNPLKITATAIAFTNLFTMIGGAIFQPLVGKLLDLGWQGKIQHGIRVYSASNYQHALATIPICILVGTLLALLLKETHQDRT